MTDSNLPTDPDDLDRVPFELPRLDPDSPSSCPVPMSDILEYLAAEAYPEQSCRERPQLRTNGVGRRLHVLDARREARLAVNRPLGYGYGFVIPAESGTSAPRSLVRSVAEVAECPSAALVRWRRGQRRAQQ